jgi:rhodanese-related sulfurtransferase
VFQKITPRAAAKLVESGEALVVDVREHNEWITGHIAGAQHAPLSRLRRSAKAYLQRDKLIFVCAAGSRSKLPAQLACGRPRLRAPAAASCRMMSSVA